jgi:UPF0716 family protein affecting phage T7 exclusion
MLAPPLEDGALKAMLALALPAVAAPMVGAPGTVTELVLLSELLPPPPQATKTSAQTAALSICRLKK